MRFVVDYSVYKCRKPGYVIVEETTQTADKEDVEKKEVCDDVNQKNVDTEVEE